MATPISHLQPLINRLKRVIARRFRSQARGYRIVPTLAIGTPFAAGYERITYAAYIQGAGMAHQALAKVQEAKRKTLLPAAIVMALPHNVKGPDQLAAELDTTTAGELADIIDAGAVAGLLHSDVIQQIAAQFKDWAGDRAATAAEYETSSAYHLGAQDAARIIGQQKGVLVQSAWDIEADACDICVENTNDGWVDEGILFASGDEAPPAHVNCFLGDTLVSAAGVSAQTRRLYEGRIYIVSIEGSEDLSVTPNHPILTRRGWVSASQLQIGDDVLKCLSPGLAASLIDPHNHHVETRIDQMGDALIVAGGVAAAVVPSSAEAFHGDGSIDNKIDIVGAARKFSLTSERIQSIEDQEFRRSGRLGIPAELLPLSPARQIFLSTFLTPDSRMSSGGKPLPFLRGYGGHPDAHSITAVALLESGLVEPAHQADTRDPNPRGHHIDALASFMRVVKVTKIREGNFRGHVFNLETDEGFYFANSIVAHNCRCSLSYRTSGGGE